MRNRESNREGRLFDSILVRLTLLLVAVENDVIELGN
jgi:hypothetical protein